MSEIKRLTLIRDPTDEFPKNANNSFKVRLPERLSLPGEGWHASLMSLTVPDQGQSNAIISADPHTKVVRFTYPQMDRHGQPSNLRVSAYRSPKGDPNAGIGRGHECQSNRGDGESVLETRDARGA